MCGILGYLATTEEGKKYAKYVLPGLILNSQTRGSEATGIAFLDQGGELEVIKRATEASKFLGTQPFKKFMKADYFPAILIGHTRQSTTGTPNDNQNNHPVFTKSGNAIVHNGTIQNSEDLKGMFKLDFEGEVDTQAIIRLLEYYSEGGRKGDGGLKLAHFTKVSRKLIGDFACALISEKQPHFLYLFRRDNPIDLAYHKPTGTLFFASDDAFFADTLTTRATYLNGFMGDDVKEYAEAEVPKNTGYRLTFRPGEKFQWLSCDLFEEAEKKIVEEHDRISALNVVVVPGVMGREGPEKDNGFYTHKANRGIFQSLDLPIKKPGAFTARNLILRLHKINETAWKVETKDFIAIGIEYKRIWNALNDRKDRKFLTADDSAEFSTIIKTPGWMRLESLGVSGEKMVGGRTIR